MAKSGFFRSKATKVNWALLSSNEAGTAPEEAAVGVTGMGLGVGMDKGGYYRMAFGVSLCSPSCLHRARHLREATKIPLASLFWSALSLFLILYLKNSSSR
jgi:hypothetical protein